MLSAASHARSVSSNRCIGRIQPRAAASLGRARLRTASQGAARGACGTAMAIDQLAQCSRAECPARATGSARHPWRVIVDVRFMASVARTSCEGQRCGQESSEIRPNCNGACMRVRRDRARNRLLRLFPVRACCPDRAGNRRAGPASRVHDQAVADPLERAEDHHVADELRRQLYLGVSSDGRTPGAALSDSRSGRALSRHGCRSNRRAVVDTVLGTARQRHDLQRADRARASVNAITRMSVRRLWPADAERTDRRRASGRAAGCRSPASTSKSE